MRGVIFLILILTISCGKKFNFFQEEIIGNQGWTYNDQVKFTFEIEDTSSYYDIYLMLDHSQDFSYQNLYTRFNTTFPSGKKVSDIVSLEMATFVSTRDITLAYDLRIIY